MLLKLIKNCSPLVFGYLLSLSMPGYELSLLAWIGLIPLFVTIILSKDNTKTILYSFLFGFAYNLSCLKWLYSLHPLDWLGLTKIQSLIISVIACLGASAYNAFFFVIFSFTVLLMKKHAPSPYNKGVLNNLIISLLWLVIFNKLSASRFLLGFPWTLIEYSQYKNLYLLQIAEYFGSQFVGFLIVFFNLAFAEMFVWIFNTEKIGSRHIPKDPSQLGTIIISIVLAIFLIFTTLGFGLQLYSDTRTNQPDNLISVCILQGNLPVKSTRGRKLDKELSKSTYARLINQCNAKLFIFPEGALPTNFTNDANTESWLKHLSYSKSADFISGSYCMEENGFTNCAVLFNSKDQKFSFYKKERLVPFGEFTPLSFLLPKLLQEFATFSLGTGFVSWKNNIPLASQAGKIGINICFELIFPDLIRNRSLSGAEVLINLSDLSWFSDPLVKKQFISFGVLRAIENRKPLIISSNDGISAVILQSGKIAKLSSIKSQYVLKTEIIPNGKKTFYVKFGW